MFWNQAIHQPLRQTDRAGELDAEKTPLIQDEGDEIRFLVWGVCVYRYLVRGFSLTHILSPVSQQAAFKGTGQGLG